MLFFVASGIRRLNFDEALALRSGWLELAGQPSAPPFHMPVVLLLGVAAHTIEDPARLFLVGRLVVAATTLGALGWMLYRARLGAVSAAAAALFCLLQAAFAVHAYEMRYGWAILVAWMVAYGLLQARTLTANAGLGACIAWLAMHHLKGVLFAGFLYLFAVGAILADSNRRDRRRRLLTVHAVALAFAICWILLSALLGDMGRLVGVYSTFAALAEGARKSWPQQALAASFARDAIWWLVAGFALAASLLGSRRALRRGPLSAAERTEIWAILFTAVPIFFLFVHPHPWPYMLAPCAPFLAILTVTTGRRALAGRPMVQGLVAVGGLLSVTVYGAATGIWPGSPYAASLRASNSDQVATLRMLQRVARPDERIIDPSGMAYFQPPCTPEWYLDSLFALRVKSGAWMQDLEQTTTLECPWVLVTYRLNALPQTVRRRIARDDVVVSGGLGISRMRPDLLKRKGWVQLPNREIRSFWW